VAIGPLHHAHQTAISSDHLTIGRQRNSLLEALFLPFFNKSMKGGDYHKNQLGQLMLPLTGNSMAIKGLLQVQMARQWPTKTGEVAVLSSELN
jgi:hypothetical protein